MTMMEEAPDRLTLYIGGSPDARGSGFDTVPQLHEKRNHLSVFEGCRSTKNEREVGHELYLVFKCPSLSSGVGWRELDAKHVVALAYESQCAKTAHSSMHLRQKQFDEINGEVASPSGEQKQAVLILNIDGVEFMEFIAPARFRLTLVDCSRDLFGGELYKSTAQNVFFVVRPIYRELDVVASLGAGTDNGEIGVVEHCSQVVNRVPQDQGDCVWDGFLGFNRQGQLAAIWIISPDDLKGALVQKGADEPVQIVDMLVRAS